MVPATSNLIVGIMLLLAGLTSNPVLFFILLLTALLFYITSWGLTISITMNHVDSYKVPRIRAFGSIRMEPVLIIIGKSAATGGVILWRQKESIYMI